jgi:hypothetical protein
MIKYQTVLLWEDVMGWFEFGVELIAIEDSDTTGWMESATTIGETTFRSLEGFVDAVLGAIGDRKLALLHIQVHGNPDGMGFGEDWVTTSSFETFRAQFNRLSGKFVSRGWINLRACNIGENLALMHKFRTLWGVGVVAGRGKQNNLFDLNFGMYQVVFPDGKETTMICRPKWVEYDSVRRGASEVLSRAFG